MLTYYLEELPDKSYEIMQQIFRMQEQTVEWRFMIIDAILEVEDNHQKE